MSKFLSDFKEFALKGNIVDMAVGVIIGGAFGKIVSSLVNDIIMPVVSLATGSAKFSDLHTNLRDAVTDPATGEVIQEAVSFNYGMFIQNIVDFVTLGSETAVKEAGKMAVEGKEYVVQDGDIMHFRFNV